jgi:vacuolar iron transporter family protein
MTEHPKTHKKLEQAQSGTARAALLGVSDGLVTNVSLILGVAAAGVSADLVLVAGIASLIAGACSMAVGEYISMRGQAELLESILDTERRELGTDPVKANATLRSKLGINPDELGSAWRSAISSFVMFSLGAVIPLVPWFFAGGNPAIWVSVGLSAASALGIGAYLGVATNGRWIWAASRQLFVLVLAAGITYMIGRLFNTSVT